MNWNLAQAFSTLRVWQLNQAMAMHQEPTAPTHMFMIAIRQKSTHQFVSLIHQDVLPTTLSYDCRPLQLSKHGLLLLPTFPCLALTPAAASFAAVHPAAQQDCSASRRNRENVILFKNSHILSSQYQLLKCTNCFNAKPLSGSHLQVEIIYSSLMRCLHHIRQFLHCFSTHMFQLAHMVIHRWYVDLPCRPGAACLHADTKIWRTQTRPLRNQACLQIIHVWCSHP